MRTFLVPISKVRCCEVTARVPQPLAARCTSVCLCPFLANSNQQDQAANMLKDLESTHGEKHLQTPGKGDGGESEYA